MPGTFICMLGAPGTRRAPHRKLMVPGLTDCTSNVGLDKAVFAQGRGGFAHRCERECR